MSRIQYYSSKGDKVFLAVYEQTLRYYINKVLERIGENDDFITWYICEEGDFPEQVKPKGLLYLERLSGVVRQPKYGLTMWYRGQEESDIYISTLAIQTAPSPQIDRLDKRLRLLKTDNLLVNVIIDELAHAKTHRNHGKEEYDDTLKRYAHKYYGMQLSRKKTLIETLIEQNNSWLKKYGFPWKK